MPLLISLSRVVVLNILYTPSISSSLSDKGIKGGSDSVVAVLEALDGEGPLAGSVLMGLSGKGYGGCVGSTWTVVMN